MTSAQAENLSGILSRPKVGIIEFSLPDMTAEIKNVYELLRISPKFKPLSQEEISAGKKSEQPAALPVVPIVAQSIAEGEFAVKERTETRPEAKAPLSLGLLGRDFVKYPVIFAVSFAFFYFFLNFGAYSDKISAFFSGFSRKPAPQEQKIEGRVLGVATPDFEAWIKKYFYQVNTPDSIAVNADYDCDGLTNYQEFQLGTNPTKVDTSNDGYSDGREVLNGYDPLGEGKLKPSQVEMLSKWDLQEVSNRLAYSALKSVSAGPGQLSNFPAINYSFTVPGRLSIPKLEVSVPLIWSQSPDDFTADLEKGVIHYPGTAYPGQLGLAYISGHSSNYIWSQSAYSHVFSRLNELKAGDEFFISLTRAEGDKISLRYVVFDRREFRPEDQTQFSPVVFGESEVYLSTCWPLGSTAKRMVVSARLAGV